MNANRIEFHHRDTEFTEAETNYFFFETSVSPRCFLIVIRVHSRAFAVNQWPRFAVSVLLVVQVPVRGHRKRHEKDRTAVAALR
jgi:hypothetical protein